MDLIDFQNELTTMLKEAFVEDDPSVGIFSPFDTLRPVGNFSQILSGAHGDFLITLTDITPVITDAFKQGEQEGLMSAHDDLVAATMDRDDEEVRLQRLVDDLERQVADLEREADEHHIENCETCI